MNRLDPDEAFICKHPDRPNEECVFSDESGDQCVHCETFYNFTPRIEVAIGGA